MREDWLYEIGIMNKKNLKLVGILSLLIANYSGAMAGVVVNEIMPCNISTYRGDDTNYSGWVELYNDGDAKVDLKGYVFKNLKKGGSEKWSWTISQSTVIQPDDYLIMFFDGKSGTNHVGYKIDTDGGTLQLLSGTTEVSSVKYGAMVPHISFGYDLDGNLGYMEPTPKKDNSTAFASLGSRCAKPVLGTQPGICNGPINLAITTTTADAKIYYTLDGTEPTAKNGTLYTLPIDVKRQDGQKSVVIRARAIKNGILSSAITSGSYIFMDDKHESCNGFTAPILSLTIDPKEYTDNTYGIGVKGTNGTTVPGKNCLSEKANYNQDWDRPANLEYIVDGKTVLSQEVEVAVMGGCSRTWGVKSLKVNASKKTGSNMLKYPFFGANGASEYKSLHIRNGGNTFDGFMIRDALLQEIARSMGLDCQEYQPIAYYINGSYKGLMGLRTRSNKDLVYAKFGLDEEDIDVIEVAETGVSASSGTMDGYEALIEALKSKDKSSPTFLDEIGEMMDVDYYIDYQIFEQFCVNTDWPGNNTKLWRERQNGRFRWIVYDVDFGFGLYGGGGDNHTDPSTDMIQFSLGKSPINWANRQAFSVEIFKNMMENKDFQERFLMRYLYHLENTFQADNIDALWAPVLEKAENEFCASPISHDWKAGLEGMRNFAKVRPSKVYEHLRSFYNGGKTVNLKVAIKDEAGNVIPGANVIMNNVSTGGAEYETSYFTMHPFRVEPRVPQGYTFKKWNTSSEVSSSVITTPLLTDKTVWSYYFKDTVPSEDWKEVECNDSVWKQGAGIFGFNCKNVVPTVKLQNGKPVYLTSYYRTKLEVKDLSSIDSMLAKLTYDDGAVVYVNGEEVARFNMPEGDVLYSTPSITYVNDEVANFFIDKRYFVEGTNTIAVEIHQIDSLSSDMTFAFSLSSVADGGAANGGEIFEGSLNSDQVLVAVYAKDANAEMPTLQLNEICSSNNSASGNADEYGNYPDWIEIYNYGTKSIDLAGFYLSDNNSKLTKSLFPYGSKNTIIEPGEHKIVYADNATWRGPLHADFKVAAAGGFLGLSCNYKGKLTMVDSINIPPLASNSSFGRASDEDRWVVFETDCEGTNLVTFGDQNLDECMGNSSDVFDSFSELADEVEPQGISLYPNPAQNWVVVRMTGEFDDETSVSGIREVSIYNPQGVMVSQVRLRGEMEAKVDVSGLEPGIYYLKAVSDRSLFATTFKKQ